MILLGARGRDRRCASPSCARRAPGRVLRDVPNQQFNHAIVYVPAQDGHRGRLLHGPDDRRARHGQPARRRPGRDRAGARPERAATTSSSTSRTRRRTSTTSAVASMCMWRRASTRTRRRAARSVAAAPRPFRRFVRNEERAHAAPPERRQLDLPRARPSPGREREHVTTSAPARARSRPRRVVRASAAGRGSSSVGPLALRARRADPAGGAPHAAASGRAGLGALGDPTTRRPRARASCGRRRTSTSSTPASRCRATRRRTGGGRPSRSSTSAPAPRWRRRTTASCAGWLSGRRTSSRRTSSSRSERPPDVRSGPWPRASRRGARGR